ncbi:MFS transporter [Candidatus Latescibacterota bacterium]
MRRPHRYLYVSCFANDFIFAYAFYTVLFSIRGLSTMEISSVLAFWALAAGVLEVPTGALADYLGRKQVVAIAPLVRSLCFVSWYFARGNALLYGLGFLFWGLSEALLSGSWEALVYDSLKARGEEHTYEQVNGRMLALSDGASAAGMVVGGLLTPLGMENVCLLSLPALVVASAAVLPLEEPRRTKAEGRGLRQYAEYFRLAWREIRTNSTLRFVVLAQLGVGILGTLEEYDQLYYQEAGIPLMLIGATGGVFFGLRSVAAMMAHRLKGSYWPLPLLTLIAGVLVVGSAVRLSIPALAPLLVAYMAGAAVRVLLEGRMQACVGSTARATVTSAASLFWCGIGVGEMLLLGWISRFFGIPGIYVAGGVYALAFGLWLLARRTD